jgi:hypothetical protein
MNTDSLFLFTIFILPPILSFPGLCCQGSCPRHQLRLCFQHISRPVLYYTISFSLNMWKCLNDVRNVSFVHIRVQKQYRNQTKHI